VCGEAITLVALTGYGESADRERSRDAGFAHHLVKPVDIDQLLSLILQSARMLASRTTRPHFS
jgi:CheY-like chemotaxis protein